VLLPYSHEDMRARRWPVITIGLAAINVAVFVATWSVERKLEPQIAESAEHIGTLWDRHPSLQLPPKIEHAVRQSPEGLAALDGSTDAAQSDHITPEERASLQAALDAEGERFEALAEHMPAQRWGYVPAHPHALAVVTSMFVHADIFHLLGNLWFLWLASVSLEDRWGRSVFLGFYLVAGVLATLAHGLTTSAPDAPMIGASGAIAGAMGAFLVLFAKTRIRFVYWIALRPGRFSAPAYVMLPLWLAEQLGSALLFPSDGGVAYGAHLGGFAFGVAAALGLKYSGIDARLDSAVDASVTVGGTDDRVEQAEQAERTGRRDEARALARSVLADAESKGPDGKHDIVAALRVLYLVDQEQLVFERFVRITASDEFTLDEAARLAAARVRAQGDAVVTALPAPLRFRLAKRLEKLGDADGAARIRPEPAPA